MVIVLGLVDMSEHYFNQTEMATLKNYPESGLYITATNRPDATVQFAGTDNMSNVWWKPAGLENLEQTAINSRTKDSLEIVVLSHDQVNTQTSFAVTFANYLFARRSALVQTAQPPYIISANQPRTPERTVRIPHLTATLGESGLEDAVMWEILPDGEAENWLQGPLPEQSTIEQHLPELIQLRRAVREQSIPDTPDHHELTRRLSAGRYISMLFVYQNVELFSTLFDNELSKKDSE
jgi:hypothetical protein